VKALLFDVKNEEGAEEVDYHKGFDICTLVNIKA